MSQDNFVLWGVNPDGGVSQVRGALGTERSTYLTNVVTRPSHDEQSK